MAVDQHEPMLVAPSFSSVGSPQDPNLTIVLPRSTSDMYLGPNSTRITAYIIHATLNINQETAMSAPIETP